MYIYIGVQLVIASLNNDELPHIWKAICHERTHARTHARTQARTHARTLIDSTGRPSTPQQSQ